uniref:Uncharacterized protein n=1 Tax=Microplitis mediator bracovirus TaxID=1836595 RepID=A0A2I6SGV4_9VIRU|nr:hypothetical protein MmBV_CPP1 [Microplitis mediator bracovirus]
MPCFSFLMPYYFLRLRWSYPMRICLFVHENMPTQ